VSRRNQVTVGLLILAGVLGVVVLVAIAGRLCPVETAAQPCPDSARNRVLVVGLAGAAAALLVAPFAFLGEVVARRRIVYRGAWSRAARRAVLIGLVIVTLAGLRLGGALSVPITIFVIILAGVVEWYFARRDT
jgi:hypothetical protein